MTINQPRNNRTAREEQERRGEVIAPPGNEEPLRRQPGPDKNFRGSERTVDPDAAAEPDVRSPQAPRPDPDSGRM